MLVKVAVDLNFNSGKDILDYQLPLDLQEKGQIGSRVKIPLGNGNHQVQGYIVGFGQDDGQMVYKAVTEILDDQPLLDEKLVQLACWVSQRYLCGSYEVLNYFLPKYARQQKSIWYHWCNQEELYRSHRVFFDEATEKMVALLQQRDQTEQQLLKKCGTAYHQTVAALIGNGLVERQEVFAQRGGVSREYLYSSTISEAELDEAWVTKKVTRAPKQRELLRFLTYEGEQSGGKLRSYWPNYAALIGALVSKGLVAKHQVQIERHGQASEVFNNAQVLQLNPEQENAVAKIKGLLLAGVYQGVLIHGVTGSGKTEIYLRAIKQALSMGRGAMVLVPEIALTPQLVGRFKGMLGETVEVLHSNLSDGERYDVWQNLRSGRIKVVVGVRSAVFAPVQNLGLIIMDEEHETTFKQSEPAPRYHARDVALYRGKISDAVVLLGSATPSVESYYRATLGQYQLIELKHRAQQQPMPTVAIVDMAQEFKTGNRSIFSRPLAMAIEEGVSRGEQVILFLNRRGFSSSVLCRECGHTMICEKCNIPLTYHKQQNLLKCHYCDYRVPLPTQCPNCGSKFIRHFGSGTQLVVEELLKKWPWLKVLRLDMDTTQNKNAHQTILEQFAQNKAQVLVGTQMVTKGLDFPNVTVVGVIAADLTLNMPDYTASERTFQLLTQVAGRAGRGHKTGQVVVQTYNPQHYSLLAGQKHDYAAFYEQEIKNRRLMGYPPYCALVRVLASDFDGETAAEAVQLLAEFVRKQYPMIELLGPAEAPITKIRNRYRYHVILKHSDLDLLTEAANHGQTYMNVSRKSKTLRIIIDVEPQSIL